MALGGRGPVAGLAEWEMALELAGRDGTCDRRPPTQKAGALAALLDSGAWDRLAWGDDLLAVPEGRLDPRSSSRARGPTHVLLARGRRADVVDPDELVGLAERIQEPTRSRRRWCGGRRRARRRRRRLPRRDGSRR
jgi:hypothetical protein